MSLLDVVAGSLHRPLLIALLVFPTTRTQRLIALAVILWADWHTYLILLNEPGLKGFNAYSQPAGMLGPIMLSLDLLLMTKNPRKSIKWPRQRGTDVGVQSMERLGQQNAEAKASRTNTIYEGVSLSDEDVGFFQRTTWATSLSFNPRCIGTNVCVANIVPLSPSLAASRRKFCLHRLFVGLMGLARLLAFYAAVIRFPVLKEAVVTLHPTLLQRALHTAGGISATYFLLNSAHCLLSFMAVALHLSDPEDWPNLFGAFLDAYTLRRAWGRSWHQNYRKPFTSIGTWVANTIGAPPHSFASRYIKLYMAFALSAFAHIFGDFILYNNRLPPGSSTAAKFTWDALFTPQFFLAQAVGIMFEDGVIALLESWKKTTSTTKKHGTSGSVRKGKGTRPTSLGRMVGYVWVFAWFCATFPPYTREVLIYVF